MFLQRERKPSFSSIERISIPARIEGEVTSGTFSPSLGSGIGMAYVPVARAVAGTRVEIDVREHVQARDAGRWPTLSAIAQVQIREDERREQNAVGHQKQQKPL